MPTDLSPAPPSTTTPAGTSGPDRRSVLDAAARGLVWLAALGVALVAPAWVAAPLTAIAALAVLDRLVRHRGRGALDAALVGLAGAVVVPIGLGLVLNLFPFGLTRLSWTVALALAGLVALGLVAGKPLPRSVFRPVLAAVPATGWVFGAGALVVVAVAVVLSVRVTQQVDTPPLAMSASAVVDGRTVVTLSSGTTQSGLQLVLTSAGSSRVVANGLTVTPDTDQAVPVTVAEGARSTLNLLDGNHAVIRQLIIDTTVTATSGPVTGTGSAASTTPATPRSTS